MAPPAVPKITLTCNNPGVPIASGLNGNWPAGGQTRQFYVAFPTNMTGPLPVIFQWHGLGDSASNFKGFIQRGGVGPDGDPSFPYILITPQSLGLTPYRATPKPGVEWDLQDGTGADKNLDLAFFESMLGCLNAQFKLDPSRIYTTGFSAGSIFSDLLHSHYPQWIPAVYEASGAWMNDKPEADSLNTLNIVTRDSIVWDPLKASDQGTIIVSHGGANDKYLIGGLEVISFEDCAAMALPFLKTNHRTALDCPHTLGHQPHPSITPRMIIEFFKAHAAGQPSPYITSGLPSDFSSICTLQTP